MNIEQPGVPEHKLLDKALALGHNYQNLRNDRASFLRYHKGLFNQLYMKNKVVKAVCKKRLTISLDMASALAHQGHTMAKVEGADQLKLSLLKGERCHDIEKVHTTDQMVENCLNQFKPHYDHCLDVKKDLNKFIIERNSRVKQEPILFKQSLSEQRMQSVTQEIKASTEYAQLIQQNPRDTFKLDADIESLFTQTNIAHKEYLELIDDENKMIQVQTKLQEKLKLPLEDLLKLPRILGQISSATFEQVRDGQISGRDLMAIVDSSQIPGIKTAEQLLLEGFDPAWFEDSKYWARQTCMRYEVDSVNQITTKHLQMPDLPHQINHKCFRSIYHVRKQKSVTQDSKAQAKAALDSDLIYQSYEGTGEQKREKQQESSQKSDFYGNSLDVVFLERIRASGNTVHINQDQEKQLDFVKDRAAFADQKYDYQPLFERKKTAKKPRLASQIPNKSRHPRDKTLQDSIMVDDLLAKKGNSTKKFQTKKLQVRPQTGVPCVQKLNITKVKQISSQNTSQDQQTRRSTAINTARTLMPSEGFLNTIQDLGIPVNSCQLQSARNFETYNQSELKSNQSSQQSMSELSYDLLIPTSAARCETTAQKIKPTRRHIREYRRMEQASARLNQMKRCLQLDLDEKYNKIIEGGGGAQSDSEGQKRVSNRFERGLMINQSLKKQL